MRSYVIGHECFQFKNIVSLDSICMCLKLLVLLWILLMFAMVSLKQEGITLC